MSLLDRSGRGSALGSPFAPTGGGGGGGEVNEGINLGGGEGLYTSNSGVNLQFKSLTAGTNITLTPSGTEVEISASGGITWATPIDSNITVDTNGLYSIGTLSDAILSIFTQGLTIANNTNPTITLRSQIGSSTANLQSSGTTPSGVGAVSLNTVSDTPNLAVWTNNSAGANASPTRDIYIETGNKTAGTGDSGSINFVTGTSAGGVRGTVDFHGGNFYLTRDGYNSPNYWASSTIPGFVINCSSTEGQANGVAGIFFDGDASNSWALIQTQDQTAGAVGSLPLDITTGWCTNTGTSGEINFQTGGQQGASGNSGNLSIATGISSNGNSGSLSVSTGTAPNGTGGGMSFTAGIGTGAVRSNISFTAARVIIADGPLRLANLSADPASLENGDMWYNTTSNQIKAYVNGATVVIA